MSQQWDMETDRRRTRLARQQKLLRLRHANATPFQRMFLWLLSHVFSMVWRLTGLDRRRYAQ